jgi:DHA1 family tetracycline resistance protein-like MFS transporter
VLPRIVPVLGEWKTALVGLCFTMVALVGYAFAWEGWVVYTVIILTVMENVADPPLRSIAAGKVPPSAQGELQGALTSISSITTIVGPLIFTQMFGYFTKPDAPVVFAGAPYLLAALFILVAAIVFLTRVTTAKAPAEVFNAAE